MDLRLPDIPRTPGPDPLECPNCEGVIGNNDCPDCGGDGYIMGSVAAA